MKWFIDLSTRGKLFVSFGLMIVLLAIILVTAYRYLTKIQSSQRTIYEVEFANAADLKDVRFYQESIRAASLTMMVLKDRQRLESLKNLGDEFTKKNDVIIRKLMDREKHDQRHRQAERVR